MKKQKFLQLCLLLLAVGALFFIYFSINPASQQSPFPSCPSRQFLGIYCPGCGSQRAVHQLLHGDWLQAFRYNPVLLLTLPLLVVLLIQWLLRTFWDKVWRIRLFENNKVLYGLFFFFILYMIARNIPIPALDWLRPPQA